MSAQVVVLRPQPGADRTAARARALGLAPLVAPLFEIRPLPWSLPEAREWEAVLLTSANAPRHGGDGLAALTDLACYAVGEATAAAARDAGFTRVTTGPSDGATILATMSDAGVRQALHLCGRDHVRLQHPRVTLETVEVYAADPLGRLPRAAAAALAEGAVALIHSPRAGARLAELVSDRARLRLAAISAAAADAAGGGWAAKAVATAPRDQALLELAARLCKNGGSKA